MQFQTHNGTLCSGRGSASPALASMNMEGLPMAALTHSRLTQVVNYDPKTGVFRWLKVARNTGIRVGAVAGGVQKATGYYRIQIDGSCYFAHRLAWLYMTGEWPRETVDHRDRNKLNNAWTNLRAASPSQNTQNIGRRSTNRVGLKGVTRSRTRFMACISIDKKQTYLGTFETAEEAHAAYVAAASKHHGEFSRCE